MTGSDQGGDRRGEQGSEQGGDRDGGLGTAGAGAGIVITLLGKPGCHLCDDARAVIERVARDLDVPWEERDITESEQDTEQYWEQIPVTLVNGVQHDFWRVDENRLRAAIATLR